MTDTTPQPLEELRRIVDEIKLKIHLAGMDARARWQELQPRIAELETKFERTGNLISEQVASIAKALRQLRDRLADELRGPPIGP
jgi:chromosome segregation ATPase